MLLGALRLDENSGVYFKLLLVMNLDYQGILCQHHHLHLSGVFPTLRNADVSHAPSVGAGISTEEEFPK